ncbi:Cna B-type domain-containing protein [Streptococcus suis]|uniref:Cna B-type domain-containing protein n=1 Tax=Streptococcus suis TaxID=1307 RepID=UPI001583F4AC|nr:Cna B-type domain-containing protein [Streptococcus suis]
MRKERKWLHRISSMILSFLMVLQVFSGSFANMQVHAQDDAEIWYATSNSVFEFINSTIRVKHPGGWSLIAYCIEGDKKFPMPGDNLLYTAWNVERGNLGRHFNKPRGGQKAAEDGVLKAIWNGYPYDMGDIQTRYQLTDNEFEILTGLAIHYFTDSKWSWNYIDILTPSILANNGIRRMNNERKRSGKPLLSDAFKELVGLGKTENSGPLNPNLELPPEELDIILFTPTSTTATQGYQKLLTLDYKRHNVEIDKRDGVNNLKLSDAEFTITKTNKPLRSIIEGDKTTNSIKTTLDTIDKIPLVPGDYTLDETRSPNGYKKVTTPIKFKLKNDGTIEFQGTQPKDVEFSQVVNKELQINPPYMYPKLTIKNYKEKTKIGIIKVNETGFQTLAGAKFELWKKGGEKVDSWDSKEVDIVMLQTDKSLELDPGSYILKEIKAPNGYIGIGEKEFTISQEGEVKLNHPEGIKVQRSPQGDITYLYISNVKEKEKPSKPKNGELKTTVSVDNERATDQKELSLTIAGNETTKNVVDTVKYSNLVTGEQYKLTGRLMKITADKEEQVGEPVEKTFTAKETTGDNEEQRIETITFENVKLEAGVKYVVYESAESVREIEFKEGKEKHKVEHADKDDKAQTVVVEKEKPSKPKNGELKTTVSVDNERATDQKELSLTIAGNETTKNVVDTVKYSNLVTGEQYKLTGRLMKITADKEEQVGEPVEKTFTAKETTGDNEEQRIETITFENVKLEAGVKYVVYESAESVREIEFKEGKEKHKVEHADKDDKAQTVVVEKEEPQEPEVTKVSVKKVWNVKEGKTVPAQVVIRLIPVNQTLTLNAENNWQGEFTNLPLKGDDGQVINYVISEDEVTGFTTEITGNKETGFVVTNTPEEVTPEIEKIEIPVTKVWSPNTPQDKMPQEITVVLDQTQERLVLNAENGWKGKFENLPKTTEDAKTIDYTISEVTVEGFTSKITGNKETGFIVTNTYNEPEEPQTGKINIPVQKIWNVKEGEILPESVEITLQPTGDKLVLSAENQWKGEFTDLPKVNEEGEEITYTITETAVEGYQTDITGDQLNGFTVTNTKEEPEKPEVTEVSVKKVWNAKEGTKIPESITVVLEQTGESVVLNAENEWKASFKDLKAKDEQGNIITYTVKEVEVEGFTSTVSGNMKEGYVIVNTEKPVTPDEPQKPETRDITVTKKWIGESLDKIVVYLMADGKKIDEVILNKENGWSHTFKDLDKIKDGKEISYTVEEQEVKGYTVKVEGNMEKGFIITNTKEDPKIPDEPRPNVPNDPGHEEPKNPAPKTPKDRGSVLPKTGDASDIGLYGLSGVLSLVGLILIRRKRKEV